jgi:hypothetical protein
VIENFEYLGEFKEYFRKCWLYCVLHLFVTERCKKKFKNRQWKSRACVPLSKNMWLIPVHRAPAAADSGKPIHIHCWWFSLFSWFCDL